MAIETAKLEAVFTADTKDFDRGVKRVSKGMGGLVKDLGGELKSLGRGIGGIGRDVLTFTAPLAAGFGLAIKSAMDFDTAMTNVGAVLGKNKNEMAGLSSEILAIGGASVQGPQAVAEAFYDIVGGVQDASLHVPILNQAISMATAGSADLAASTSALVATMNSYGFEADKATYVSDVFTQTVNKGVGTMDEFAAAFPSVTGMANSMGIELHDLGTYMAFMTTKGVSASEASTLLRGAMSKLLNPSVDLQKAINALGYDTGEAMVKAVGLEDSLRMLKDYNGGTFAGLITDQEALRGALILTDDGLGDFAQSFNETLDGVTARTEALQMEGVANQFGLLTSKISEMGIKIGDALLPVLVELADKFAPVVNEIVDWIGKNPELVQTIAMLTLGAGALGLVMMPLGTIIGGIGTAATITSGAMGLLGGVIGVLLSPIALLLGAGMGLIYLFTGEGGIVGGIQRALTAIGQLALIIGVTLMNAISDLINSPLVQSVRNVFKTVFDAIGNMVNGFIDTFETIGVTIQVLADSPVFGTIIGAFQNAFNEISNIVRGVVDGITGFLNGVKTAIEDVLISLGLMQARSTAVVDSTRNAMYSLSESIKSMMQGVSDTLVNQGRINAPTPVPKRNALGGNVARGQWSWVGEDGPELVKFGQSATVFSNPMTPGGNNYGGRMVGAGAGGGNITINNLNLNGVQNAQQLFDQLRKIGNQRGG